MHSTASKQYCCVCCQFAPSSVRSWCARLLQHVLKGSTGVSPFSWATGCWHPCLVRAAVPVRFFWQMLLTDFCGNHSVQKYRMFCWKMCTSLYTLLSDRRLNICLQIEAKRLWKLNEALSLGILSPVASLYTPLAPPSGARGLPHLHWQPDRAFHTGALCAAALDSVTLPYRLHRPAPTSPLGAASGACCTDWHRNNSGPHLKSQLSSCC